MPALSLTKVMIPPDDNDRLDDSPEALKKNLINKMPVTRTTIWMIVIALALTPCNAQKSKKMNDKDKNNPLLCDIETGMCELPAAAEKDSVKQITVRDKPVKIIYFTDPICSSCWGIEPQLRKLKLEYGNDIDMEYRMGGLLPDWSYNSGGISQPSDVAHHWDEVSRYYDMPIDGDVWLEDPLASSYPPSIAFKAAQMQDPEKAIIFLRKLRELLFLQKKNITKWEYVEQAAKYSGLDAAQLKKDYEGEAPQRFSEDLELARKLGVRGFPSIFFADQQGNTEFVYGSKPYPVYEGALLKLYPGAVKTDYATSWEKLFEKYPTLTVKELAVLSGVQRAQAEAQLESLVKEGKLRKIITKNGSLYSIEEH